MLAATCALVLSLVQTQQLPFDVRVSDPHLLRHESVQRELKLTSDQITKIQQVRGSYKSEAKRTKSWKSDKERAAVAKHLNTDQLKRLREISLQTSGPIVLIVDFIAERAGVTPERHKQIEKTFHNAFEEGFRPMREKIDKMVNETLRGAGSPQEIEKRSEEIARKSEQISEEVDHNAIQRDAVQRIVKMLTPSERKGWSDLQGAPFPVEKLKDSNIWDD